MRHLPAAAAIVLALLLEPAGVLAEPTFAGPGERHPASVAITLHRADLKHWVARRDDVRAFCFFHAANVAEVDGRWYAINGIARTGLKLHWIEDDGRRETLEDGDKARGALRGFLYDVNDKMNDACP